MTDQMVLMLVGSLGFVINMVVLAVGGIWKLSRVEQAVRETIADHRQEIDAEFTILRKEVGETTAAIRAKVTEVELFSRDEFVRKRSFEAVIGEMRGDLKSIGDKIEARLLRMEGKMDRATNDRAT